MRSLLADRHAYVAGLVTAIVGFTSAFVVTGLLIVATAAVPALGTLIARIPTSIAQAMLAGVIVPLCLKPVLATATSPGLMWPILLAWVVVLLHRVHPCRPALRLASGVGIALPLWLVTMGSQNVPGVAVLKSFGYETPWRPTLLVTGIGTVVGAFAGGHAICMAAVLYLFLAAGAGIVTAIVLAAPGGLLPAAAGLALVGTLSGSIQQALDDARGRLPAAVTFLVAASGITVLGIGGAFWALVVGVALRFILVRHRATA